MHHNIATLIIPLEYAIWLLPTTFVLIGIYRIAQKSGETRGLFLTLPSFVLVTVSVTIKEYLVLHPNTLTLYQSFFVGNVLILISYTFLLYGTKRMIEGEDVSIRVPARAWVYFAVFVAFAISPAFKKEYLVAADLLVYVSIMFITIYIAGVLFFMIKENKRNNSYFISIFVVSLVIDFILKGVAETTGINGIDVLKFGSFAFRVVTALLMLVFLITRKEIGKSKIEKVRVLHPIDVRFARSVIIIYLVISVVFGIATYGTMVEIHRSAVSTTDSYAYTLSKDAFITGESLTEKVTGIRSALSAISMNASVVDLDERGKEILINFYRIYQDVVKSITRMSAEGKIVFTYPYESFVAANISGQPHIQKLLKTHKPALSDPIKTVQGFYAIIYHTPVFKGDEFDGSVGILFDLDRLGESAETRSFSVEKIIIADTNGTIVYPVEKPFFLKKLNQFLPAYSTPEHPFVKSTLGTVLVKARKTYLFYDKPYTVVAYVDRSAVLESIVRNSIPLILTVLVFVLSFVGFLMLIMYAYEKRNKETEEVITRESRALRTLSEKLQSTIATFSEVDIDEKAETFYRKLLDSALKLIHRGDAGSIIVKEGDYYVYKTVKGFDEKLVGMRLSRAEAEIGKKKSAYIIRHIYQNTRYSDETKSALQSAGTPRIQATIEAPLIVNGEYFGGIFIDSFESANAFNKTDLKIANAISKLGSIYLKNRMFLKEAKDAEMAFSYIISAFSELDISLSEDKFFNKILLFARTLVPQADAGSITLRDGASFRYVAAFGYGKEIFAIRLDPVRSFAVHEKNAFITDNINYYNRKHLDEDLLKAFSRIGAERIKKSLVAPIIVHGQYMGGIFLDSFDKEIEFTEREVKIASAFSNLASAFVSNREAYKKLLESSMFDVSSLSLFHSIGLKTSEAEAVKIAYRILSALYPGKLEEVAVGEIAGNFVELIKFNGKSVEHHVFELQGTIKEALRKKRTIFVNGSTGNPSIFNGIDAKKAALPEVVVFSNTKNVPIFRVRFSKSICISEDERRFFERFGREATMILESATLFRETKELFIGYVVSLANAISARDPYTRGHSERVAAYAILLAEKLNISEEAIRRVALAGILHDVGKLIIPLDILTKAGKLTEEEFEKIKQHPVRGYEIVEPIDPDIAEIVRAHHERMDGKGYPDGLKYDEIPFEARIITVADVYDALTTNRPYRSAFTHEKAVEIMKDESSAHFDPNILNVFLKIPEEVLEETKTHPDIIEKLRKYL